MSCLWLGPQGLTVGFLLIRYSVVCTVDVFSDLSPFYILMCMYIEMMHQYVWYLS